jgi:uncharacterized protein (DUF2147 family)
MGGGKLYDPEDGKSYHLRIYILDEDTLRVRAYEYFFLFGRVQIWTRIR